MIRQLNKEVVSTLCIKVTMQPWAKVPQLSNKKASSQGIVELKHDLQTLLVILNSKSRHKKVAFQDN